MNSVRVFLKYNVLIVPQVDASKAPGYRGNALCSPNLQKPPPSIRSSSAASSVTSLSPSGSLSFSNSSNSIGVDQISASVTAPIARPTSVPSSMDGSHSAFTPRALFHDKAAATLFGSREVNQGGAGVCVSSSSSNCSVNTSNNNNNAAAAVNVSCSVNNSMLKMVQSTVSGDSGAANLLSPYHSSMSYSQPAVTTTVSMSRLNPRAPDFSTTIKPPTAVSIPANQLPPTHQPPPIFNQQSQQQSLTANFLSSQLPPSMIAAANSNMMSFPLQNKYATHQQQQQHQHSSQRTDMTAAPSQWSLMNAAAVAAAQQQQSLANYSTPNDLINFAAATPNTTLSNLIHAHVQQQAAAAAAAAASNDMLSVLENGALANSPLNISPNSNATNLMAAGVSGAAGSGRSVTAAAAAAAALEERKMPPKPIGTERAWRTERERAMPVEQQDAAANWIMDQKLSWNQQMFRNSGVPSTVTAMQPTQAGTPYSCLPQLPDDMRQTMLDNSIYQVNECL